MANFERFRTVKREPVRLSQETLVQEGLIVPTQPLPLLMRPAVAHVNLAAWATANRAAIDRRLFDVGAILFRGFDLGGVDSFARAAAALASPLVEYGERSSPRTRIAQGIYTSTDHPMDEEILLHNEQSYTLSWPMKLVFFCGQPPRERGRTPIADSRRILRRLPAALVEELDRRQVLYVRNYGHGVGLSWPVAFQTESRADVEAHCRMAGIDVEWRPGGGLCTRQVRPAVRRHPTTGEATWFNHAAFFHATSLDPSVREVLGADEVPYSTFYGDGAPIEPEVMAEIRAAYRAEMVSFAWQKDDLLLIDNMLTSHGRESFVPPREILVAMGELVGAEPSGGGA